jgi:hypothetical protein
METIALNNGEDLMSRIVLDNDYPTITGAPEDKNFTDAFVAYLKEVEEAEEDEGTVSRAAAAESSHDLIAVDLEQVAAVEVGSLPIDKNTYDVLVLFRGSRDDLARNRPDRRKSCARAGW